MWLDFTKRYRKTVKRVLKIRNDFKTKFEFKPSEAFDFYYKEKSKYSSYNLYEITIVLSHREFASK